MNLQEAWDIIEICLHPDYSQCMDCSDGGCDWPEYCDCSCHNREHKAREQLPQAVSGVKRDSERLDFLELQNSQARYTGKCIFRQSVRGRGWRLHETSWPGAVASVRQAIDEAMAEHQEEGQCVSM